MVEIKLKYFSKKNSRQTIAPGYFYFLLKYIDKACEVIYEELCIEKKKKT